MPTDKNMCWAAKSNKYENLGCIVTGFNVIQSLQYELNVLFNITELHPVKWVWYIA